MKTTNDEREALLAAAKAEYSSEAGFAALRAEYSILADLDAAIIAMGGKPDSPAWDDWDITDLLRLGDAARHVMKAYGATLTIELPKTQLKRGPKPLTQDELMEIAWELETAKERDGTPNYIYIQIHTHITKHSATKAIQFVTDNPSIYGKFREKMMLQSRRR